MDIKNSLSLICLAALMLAAGASRAGTNYTSAARQGGGNWDSGVDSTTGIWNPGAHTASGAVAVDPSATFELTPPGARLRTTILVSPPPDGTGDPYTATPLVFPGSRLTIDGDGVYRNGAAASAPIAEVRFKCPAVFFPGIVMNGGTWDEGDTTSSNGMVSVRGEVNVNGVNFPVYNDGGADRGFQIDYLTGSGSIEIHSYTDVTTFKPGYKNSFLLVGSSNTYSGTWNVVIGMLNGYGSNSLGTNSITVATAGGLITSYDINNTNSDLILSGRMFLHQNHTFRSVIVGGTNVLSPGTYTAAQLNAAYPANFPASWLDAPTQFGYLPDTITNISGSITVLSQPCISFTQPPTPAAALLGAGPVAESNKFAVFAVGAPPIAYRWQFAPTSVGPFTNINNSGVYSGVTSNVLTITSPQVAHSGFYVCMASNSSCTVVSPQGQLTVLAQQPATNFTTLINEALGSDWDSPGTWAENTNGASYLAAIYPGSTFKVLAGGNLRTPNAALDSVFPIYAAALEVDGDGVFANPAAPHLGTIQFKNASNGRVAFKKLSMNGGQLNNGQDNSYVILDGEVDILTNTPIFEPNDSGSGNRGFVLPGLLAGNGTIEAHMHVPGPGITQPLNIAGNSNTFSGTWNIVNGVLLGTGTNSLGNNDILINDDFAGPGALETLYDIYNPEGSLIIEGAGNAGQVYLHQNDSFMAVRIAGIYLTNGTYTIDDLMNNYPANFPPSWVQQVGSSFSTASGSITVLGVPLKVARTGPDLQLSWKLGALLEADQVTGPWTTNVATSPYIFSPTNSMKFYRVIVQAAPIP